MFLDQFFNSSLIFSPKTCYFFKPEGYLQKTLNKYDEHFFDITCQIIIFLTCLAHKRFYQEKLASRLQELLTFNFQLIHFHLHISRSVCRQRSCLQVMKFLYKVSYFGPVKVIVIFLVKNYNTIYTSQLCLVFYIISKQQISRHSEKNRPCLTWLY